MKTIQLAWWAGMNGKNWGDALSPVLARHISGGARIEYVNPIDNSSKFRFYSIGSIIPPASSNSEIWGSGIIQNIESVKIKPTKVHAVRGPLTRKILTNSGIACPEVYGDPALLYPKFYNPTVDKKYEIGIIPHYVDQKHPWVTSKTAVPGVKFINILGDIDTVVNEILSCDMIISSSLHGVIAADAYGIPSVWVEFSDKVLGNGFKFKDYFMSVGRTDQTPIRINMHTRLVDIKQSMSPYRIKIDLDALYESCPYK
jgi:pyruvyltransferase